VDDLQAAEVTDSSERRRYELRLGGELVGHADYRRSGTRIEFTHTEVEPALQGNGLGSRLVAEALADARRQRLEIVPLCPFVADFMAQHPETPRGPN